MVGGCVVGAIDGDGDTEGTVVGVDDGNGTSERVRNGRINPFSVVSVHPGIVPTRSAVQHRRNAWAHKHD